MYKKNVSVTYLFDKNGICSLRELNHFGFSTWYVCVSHAPAQLAHILLATDSELWLTRGRAAAGSGRRASPRHLALPLHSSVCVTCVSLVCVCVCVLVGWFVICLLANQCFSCCCVAERLALPCCQACGVITWTGAQTGSGSDSSSSEDGSSTGSKSHSLSSCASNHTGFAQWFPGSDGCVVI